MNAFLRDTPLPPLLPADVQQRADTEFGAAWRRCEAALPEGWWMRITRAKNGAVSAVAFRPDNREKVSGVSDDGFDPPMVTALTALAEALEARKEADAD